jgi:ABC-type transport system involved in cytochrome c biogenesis permease subunit
MAQGDARLCQSSPFPEDRAMADAAFLLAGLVLAGGALAWGLTLVSPDRLMGETVRILFIHVPTAWLGMAAG